MKAFIYLALGKRVFDGRPKTPKTQTGEAKMANDLSGRNSGSVGPQQTCDVSRRQLFYNAAAIAGGVAVLAAAMVPQRAEAGQMTQQAAGYKTTPKGDQRCDGCSLFKAPASCKFVAGDISPSGWCRLYVKKS